MKRTPLTRKTPLKRSAMSRGKGSSLRQTALRAVGQAKRRRMAAYAAHLRSPAWKALRRVVFERDGYRCVDCGEEAGYFLNGKRDIRGLECDHLHYRTLFRETPKDCATRCRPCHRRKHAGQWWKRIPIWAFKSATNQAGS